ncbi:BTB domain-containing protein (variant) [Frankliniella occidentalis]|uniref:Protein abrupt-like isoform X1 n=1 Tax=Frankliniella occidentalis TaxID=133901 RepID=A0A6J1T6Y6_FRAOC|nr:protein abrupt-like isoform X1 [Frankliniella occidentalis]KAE8753029.1 BTB domain-containing protein (variant) [Frankliniella occidentalis]
MAPDPQFCLRWNNFQTNITSQFETLRQDEDFVDVTLTCDGKSVKAHKVVLSACSPYFKELFKNNPCKHPIIILKDVQWCHLCALVEFMYAGVVNVSQAELPTFLQTAESLHILGLTDAPRLHRDGKPIKDSSKKASASIATPNSATPTNTDTGEEDNADGQSRSPPSSPPPTKRAKATERAEERTIESSEGQNSADGPGNESIDETGDPVSSLLQHSRSGLVITPSQHQNDIDQAYNDDLAEMLEPKTELPDYSSDGETRGDANAYLDQASYGGMQEMMPGPSTQGASDGTSAETDQAALRKLHSLDPRPCPICQRMYSNLSNLRQHMRLIHIPQSVECPLCSRSFKTKLYLRRHLLSYHEMLSKQPGPTNSQPLQPSQLHISPVASNMPPPTQPYYSVEEELKRTYLQSPHKTRAHNSVPGHISQSAEVKQDKEQTGAPISHNPGVGSSSMREQQSQQLQQQQSQQQQHSQSQQQQAQSSSVPPSFPFPSNLLYAGTVAGSAPGSLPPDYMRSARFNPEGTHQLHHTSPSHAFASSASNRLGYHNAPYSSNS